MMFRLLPAAAMTATALAGMTAGAATVDVYGVVDTGLHYVKADSGDTSVTMDSGISKGSRVGLRAAGVLSARIRTMYPKEESLMCWHLVNPLRPIINWTGLPCLLPARTAWAQIAGKLRNLRSHGAQLRVNPN